MSQRQVKPRSALDTVDPVWARIRREAEDIVQREPELAASSVRPSYIMTGWKPGSPPLRSGSIIPTFRQSSFAMPEDAWRAIRDQRGLPGRHRRNGRARSGHRPLHRASALPLITPSKPTGWRIGCAQGPQGFRLLPAKPLFLGV
jgi:hypothetical protein